RIVCVSLWTEVLSAAATASIMLESRIYSSRIEDSLRIEGSLDAACEIHDRVGLRLEHLDRRAQGSGSVHKGCVTAIGLSGLADDRGTPIALRRSGYPDESATPVVEPLRLHAAGDLRRDVRTPQWRGRDAPDRPLPLACKYRRIAHGLPDGFGTLAF